MLNFHGTSCGVETTLWTNPSQIMMRCTRCNRRFFQDNNSLMTTVAEQTTGAGVTGARTEVRYVLLCPECTAARRKTERLFLWMVLLGFGLAALAIVLSRIS